MKHISSLILGMLFIAGGKAQDLHFSQYFNAPLLVNPANTGFMPDYDYRVGGNYRDQWANLGNPYKTMSVWGDAQLFNDRFENGWVGVGGALLKDVAGSGSLSSTQAFASVAYHQMLSGNSLLSGGIGLGLVNKRVDLNKLTFDDQWNGQFFDGTVSPNEPFLYSSIYYFDLQLGVNYAWFASDNVYLNAGLSVMHLNRPRESFYGAGSGVGQIDRRYTAFLNSNIKIQNLWILNPNVYVSKMASAWEVVAGMNANRNLSGDGSNQLILGLYYRNNDAVIPVIGYQLNDLKITFNYDATVSSLGSYNGTAGAYEISIVKSGIYGGNKATKQVKCPSVKF
jgi:type IX secretion system PorP/SprF family membrane protein